MEKKNYTLRNPKAEDIFLMFRILSKIDVKNVKKCFQAQDVAGAIESANGNQEAAVSAVGMSVLLDIVGVVLEHIDDAKKDIYAFLSNLSGLSADEIAQMEAGDFAEMVISVVQLEGFRDFFQRVFGLLK